MQRTCTVIMVKQGITCRKDMIFQQRKNMIIDTYPGMGSVSNMNGHTVYKYDRAM